MLKIFFDVFDEKVYFLADFDKIELGETMKKKKKPYHRRVGALR